MKRKLRNIISLFLLMAIILSSIVELEHPHPHFYRRENKEKYFLELRQKCGIYNFVFTSFISMAANIDLLKAIPTENYSNNCDCNYSYYFSRFSFLLRAPPCRYK
jgi:hypothetical protein